MDHKVSKDMISSGMIPSGEKTQADLGKTQYGSAPSPSKLMDAYKSMYDKKEEVINEHHKKDADGNTIPHEDEIKQSVLEQLTQDSKEIDKFDAVIAYLIDETFAKDWDEAQKIMTKFKPEIIEEIYQNQLKSIATIEK